MRYVFGDFVLDSLARQLLRAGREVPIGPKAFELLELLVRTRPEAVSRTRAWSALWPTSHVGRTSLHVLVSQVRAALDDDAQDPRWIRTVERFGYAFAGEASEELPPPGRPGRPRAAGRARLTAGDAVYSLRDGENLVGRQKGLAASVRSPSVSRRHARIVLGDGKATVEDLGSRNGTFVGGERLSSPRALMDGDVVRLGPRLELVFAWEEDDTTDGGLH